MPRRLGMPQAARLGPDLLNRASALTSHCHKPKLQLQHMSSYPMEKCWPLAFAQWQAALGVNMPVST